MALLVLFFILLTNFLLRSLEKFLGKGLDFFLIIEGILYALFPSKMKNMLKKLEMVKDSQLRTGGLLFAVIGFFIIWYIKS